MDLNHAKKERPLKAFLFGYSKKNFTESQLSRSLDRVFPLIKMVVRIPTKEQKWKGYAFVDFTNRGDFLSFVRKRRIRLPEFDMNLVLKPYKSGKALKIYNKDFKKRRIEVKNIPEIWDDFMLEAFFEQFGQIENAFVKDSGMGEKIGIIIFSAKRTARSCIKKKWFQVEGRKIEVCLFEKNIDLGSEKKQKKSGITGDGNMVSRKKRGIRKIFLGPKNFDDVVSYHQITPVSRSYFKFNRFSGREGCYDNLRINQSKDIGKNFSGRTF